MIGLVGQRHDRAHGLGIFTPFIGPGDVLGGPGQAVKERCVMVARGQAAGKASLNKAGRAAGDIDDLADQIRVHPQ